MRKIHYICGMKTEQEVKQYLKELSKEYDENREFLKNANSGITIGEIKQLHLQQKELWAEISGLRWVLKMDITEYLKFLDDKDSEK